MIRDTESTCTLWRDLHDIHHPTGNIAPFPALTNHGAPLLLSSLLPRWRLAAKASGGLMEWSPDSPRNPFQHARRQSQTAANPARVCDTNGPTLHWPLSHWPQPLRSFKRSHRRRHWYSSTNRGFSTPALACLPLPALEPPRVGLIVCLLHPSLVSSFAACLASAFSASVSKARTDPTLSASIRRLACDESVAKARTSSRIGAQCLRYRHPFSFLLSSLRALVLQVAHTLHRLFVATLLHFSLFPGVGLQRERAKKTIPGAWVQLHSYKSMHAGLNL